MGPTKTKKLGKRKKVVLSIRQKIDICYFLETGVHRKVLMKAFNVGSSTISGIKAQKTKLLKFLNNGDPVRTGSHRSTLRKGKLEKLEDVLFEWYTAVLTEHCKVTGSMIIDQAKYLHKQMKIKKPCTFSNGWLSRFKLRHGIGCAAVGVVDRKNSDKEPTFCEATKTYREFFSTLIAEHDLSADQIYSACETKLFWRSLHDTNNLPEMMPEQDGMVGSEEHVTVLLCANSSGRHKLNVFAVGEDGLKSYLGRCDSSVDYNFRSNGAMDKELYTQWFETIFVPSVKCNLKNAGRAEDDKVLLLLDNYAQRDLKSDLVCGNVFTVFLPYDVSSFVLPMKRGVINDFKCNYRIDVMKKLCRHEMTNQYFLSQFSTGDVINYLAGSWQSVSIGVLRKSWQHLLPSSLLWEQSGEGGLKTKPRRLPSPRLFDDIPDTSTDDEDDQSDSE